jgi:transcriptional regulator with XRE-family HTH domain
LANFFLFGAYPSSAVFGRQNKISQDKLSKLANISHNTIIKIESGAIQNPTIETVQKIAKALGVTVDKLLNLNNK